MQRNKICWKLKANNYKRKRQATTNGISKSYEILLTG
jgi:hypothetical protein